MHIDEHNTSLTHANFLDQQDELSAFRDSFHIADPDLLYLDGNSLGRLPKQTLSRLHQAIEEEWGSKLIESWNQGWYDAPQRIGDKLAALIGAKPGEVAISESTTTNFYKLTMAALAHRKGRNKIISDVLNFPTDLYILQGCIRHFPDQNYQIQLIPSQDDVHIPTENVIEAIDDDTALVTFSTPTFKSGFLHEIEAITQKAHQTGALVLWDLSHGIGSVPFELHKWSVDLAVGCTYKYLNGGPGAPAFLYVREDLQNQLSSPISGWWGHSEPFAFDLDYKPASSIQRFLTGTPPVLSLLAIEPALDIVLSAGIDRIREKSKRITDYLCFLSDQLLTDFGFHAGSPRSADQRGSHISLQHPEAYRICQALIKEMSVIPDFREPDNIRLGIAPLYTQYADVWKAINRIREVVENRLYEHYSTQRAKVT